MYQEAVIQRVKQHAYPVIVSRRLGRTELLVLYYSNLKKKVQIESNLSILPFL